MRDIPVWLVVLVGMVGVLAVSLLVYLLLPRKSAAGRSAAAEPAEPDSRAAPDVAAEERAPTDPVPVVRPSGVPTVAPPDPGSEKPAQTVQWPAEVGEQPASVVLEHDRGRPAFWGESAQPAGTAQHQAANGAPATHADPAAPTGPAEPTEALRNGAGPIPRAAFLPQDTSASSAPYETVARNGASAGHWKPPAVPPEPAAPSPETLTQRAERVLAERATAAEPPAPPPAEAPAAANALFEPILPPDPAHPGFGPTATASQSAAHSEPPGPAPRAAAPPESPTPQHLAHPPAHPPAAPPLATDAAVPTAPSGLATDPAMAAFGWNQAPPLSPADAEGQPQVSEPTATAAQQLDAYPNSLPQGPGGSPQSEEYTIKGNEGSRRFHPPDSPFYIRTRADVWFRTAEDAERAGFIPWNQRRR